MTTIAFQGWHNLYKVRLTKLFMEVGGLPLRDSKFHTDTILYDGLVVLEFENDAQATLLLEKARALGAHGKKVSLVEVS